LTRFSREKLPSVKVPVPGKRKGERRREKGREGGETSHREGGFDLLPLSFFASFPILHALSLFSVKPVLRYFPHKRRIATA
jgi:hypothetical protein